MNRPDRIARRSAQAMSSRRGFTIIEILVAVTITLILMGAVVQVFVWVSTGISDARGTLEMQDRLRSTANRLQKDLQGVTVPMIPPRSPENEEGYFEYTEGPMTDWRTGSAGVPRLPVNTEPPNDPDFRANSAFTHDFSVGDVDDMLMFTTRSEDRPFTGRYTIQSRNPEYPANDPIVRNVHVMTANSPVAEVAWFMRGRTLYRRQLLVAPHLTIQNIGGSGGSNGLYRYFDISVRPRSMNLGTGSSPDLTPVANSLGDLTKPENRFCHWRYTGRTQPEYPHHPWGEYYWSGTLTWPWLRLGLPIMAECASNASLWPACDSLSYVTKQALRSRLTLDASTSNPVYQFDAWRRPCPYENVHPMTGSVLLFYNPDTEAQQARNFRVTDDVILTNCIGFDVKAWDPGAPIYRTTLPAYGTTPARDVTISPSDPGYLEAIRRNLDRVGYGAYADLGYAPTMSITGSTWPIAAPRPHFNRVSVHPLPNGDANNNLYCFRLKRVWDTWSTHYDSDGLAQPAHPGAIDAGNDGYDNDGQNGPDDIAECDSAPPYPYALRSIRIRIRAYEPDSRQIREVTVIQDFLPR
jgi:prepilin-type N-terminal cleavage/methylation domain-containing protein